MPLPLSVQGRPPLRLVGGSELEAEVDTTDFDAVFRRYSAYVARIAVRLMGTDSELDDAVQEVFIEAHRGLQTLRDPRAVRGWLARICVRRTVRRLRRRRLLSFLSLDAMGEGDEPLDPGESPERQAEVRKLYRMLDTMPVEERVVWVLRYVEGESLDAIVVLCGCSKSTVQRRLRSAQARFVKETA
jgi:RNA polymerase sigma-70 factor (ECF subfamily)